MTLPASGTITSAMIRAEMDDLVGDLILPSAGTLWLAGKAAAPIVWPTDFYGQTWGPSIVSNDPNTERFGALSSPGSQFTLPSGAPFTTGDLAIITQYVESEDASIPASVTPSGWTAIGSSVTTTTAEGRGARMNSSYRILTAGQVGDTFTGMNGLGRNRVCGRLFHFNRPIVSVTVIDSGASLSSGIPAAQNVAWNSVRDGSHLYVGHAHGQTSIADADFDWTTAAEAPLGSASETRTWHRLYANTAPVSSITMSLADKGHFSGIFSALLRLK